VDKLFFFSAKSDLILASNCLSAAPSASIAICDIVENETIRFWANGPGPAHTKLGRLIVTAGDSTTSVERLGFIIEKGHFFDYNYSNLSVTSCLPYRKLCDPPPAFLPLLFSD